MDGDPGQSSGLSWTYLGMHSGQPRREGRPMVRRFVADTLGVDEQQVSSKRAAELVTQAATASAF